MSHMIKSRSFFIRTYICVSRCISDDRMSRESQARYTVISGPSRSRSASTEFRDR